MEIVDTVYLIAYFRPNDPLHDRAIEVLEGLDEERRVSQAALIELDLLMKSRGFNHRERDKVWTILSKVIDVRFIEPITPLDMAVSAYLTEKYKMDYFDSIVASQCIMRKASPLTADKEIESIVSRAEKVISELKEEGVL